MSSSRLAFQFLCMVITLMRYRGELLMLRPANLRLQGSSVPRSTSSSPWHSRAPRPAGNRKWLRGRVCFLSLTRANLQPFPSRARGHSSPPDNDHKRTNFALSLSRFDICCQQHGPHYLCLPSFTTIAESKTPSCFIRKTSIVRVKISSLKAIIYGSYQQAGSAI